MLKTESNNMKKKRNQRPSSEAALAKLLLDQPLCCHSKKIARWLARNGAREEQCVFGSEVIREGDASNRDVFCVVSGKLEISIGGHRVSERGKHTHVGEMSMIMNEPRTASASTTQDSTLIRIPAKTMLAAYKKFPVMWEPIAKTLCDRLHERRKFFRAKNKHPIVFIGSSGARKFVAEALKEKLEPLIKGEVRVWADDSIFAPSANTLESLIEQSKKCDFGIFIFGADDKVNSKGKRFEAPRDNVVFEGGMFTGTCGICRTFFVCEDHKFLKMPSDLSGVTYLNFKLQEVKKKQVPKFGTAVKRIADVIEKLKVV